MIGTGTVTAVKTVADAIQAAKDGYDGINTTTADARRKNKENGVYSYSSTVKAASELMVVYPILASKTLSKNAVEMIYKHIEQFGGWMLQMALQAANISSSENAQRYIKHFHQNIDLSGNGAGELYKWTQSYSNESTGYIGGGDFRIGEDFDDSYLFESDVDMEVTSTELKALLNLMESNANIKTYDTNLNPISLNSFEVSDKGSNYRLRFSNFNEAKATNRSNRLQGNMFAHEIDEDDRDTIKKENENRRAVSDARANAAIFGAANSLRGSNAEARAKESEAKRAETKASAAGYDLDAAQQRARKEKENRMANNIRNRYSIAKERSDASNAATRAEKTAFELQREREKAAREDAERARQEERNRMVRFQTEVKDTEVKKFNSATPTIIKVTFFRGDESKNGTTFLMGVKSKILLCNASEILRRIANDNADGKHFLNLMRTITGELKASEFLFGLSRIADDLKTVNKRGAYGNVWETLKNRSMLAKEQLRKGAQNDFSSITTVAISREDADSLYREENIDITDDRVAYHFMQSYNLMAFAIADDSIESVKIMIDDGSKKFEEYSYNMLSKEGKDNDMYKKMLNLLAGSR